MIVTIAEAKNYLRVDHNDDDQLIGTYLCSAERLCMDILRTDDPEGLAGDINARVAVLYAAAFLYEHREEADFNALMLSLRALLSGGRKAGF